MSNFKTEDIVFGRCLRDPGYNVDFAVGTTYSLDLDTFISLPFSLGILEEPDEVMKKSVVYIFSALRTCSDKLAVFCNFSDISVPPQTKKIYYALMENSVFSINATKKKNQIVNFHPKVWVIKETNLQQETIIKVIVMSRNLTKDGSLDCICILNGKVGAKPAPKYSQLKHEPLCAFLKYLGNRADPKKRTKIGHIIDDILKIKAFDIEDSIYDDYDFFPMGITGYSGLDALEEIADYSYDAVVVSPFLDDLAMDRFQSARNRFLLTREDSITEKALDIFGYENIWTMNPQMIDNDLDESVNLHAKMYFSTPRGTSDHYLYLGSTNATMGGFERNVEFLVRLKFRQNRTSFSDFTSFFTKDDEKRFSQMIDLPADLRERLEDYNNTQKVRKLIASIKEATVSKEGDLYSVSLRIEESDIQAKMYPILRPDMKMRISPDLTFHKMSMIELSEFYVIETKDLSRVVKIPTKGIPQGRDDEICRKIIDTPDKFMDCISFLLSEDKTAYVIERMTNRGLYGKKGDQRGDKIVFSSVYESMLSQAYDSPDLFKDIRTFVDSLPPDLVPKEFESLYRMMSKAFKSIRK